MRAERVGQRDHFTTGYRENTPEPALPHRFVGMRAFEQVRSAPTEPGVQAQRKRGKHSFTTYFFARSWTDRTDRLVGRNYVDVDVNEDDDAAMSGGPIGRAGTRGMRIVLILNPKAGGVRPSRIAAVRDVLQRCGAEVSVVETTAPGHATQLAREAAATGPDMIMTAGGDGTINEAANGLAGSMVPLAVLPFGSANVLAREIGLPLDPVAAAAVCCKGRVADVWPGVAGKRRFLLMVGVGFDAAVLRRVDASLKARVGRAAYVLAGMQMLTRPWRSRYHVTTGKRSIQAASVIVANAAHYAGPWIIAPDATLFRRELDVCVFRGSARADLVRYAFAVMRGRHAALPDVEMFRTKSLRIEGGPECCIQIDGDEDGDLPVEICVAGETLPLVVPAESAVQARAE